MPDRSSSKECIMSLRCVNYLFAFLLMFSSAKEVSAALVLIDGGVNDNYLTTNGPELATPRTSLATEIANPNSQMQYDATLRNQYFIETLDLPTISQTIQSATLRIAAKPLQNAQNDMLHLFASTWPTTVSDSYSFATLNGGGWFDTSSNSSGWPAYFDLVLSSAVLSDMMTNQRLDIYVQDDTAIDYVQLRIETVPEPTTLGLALVPLCLAIRRRR